MARAVSWLQSSQSSYLNESWQASSHPNSCDEAYSSDLSIFLGKTISMFFGFIAIVSRGLRWVILLQNLSFSVNKLNSVYAVAIGYFTNCITHLQLSRYSTSLYTWLLLRILTFHSVNNIQISFHTIMVQIKDSKQKDGYQKLKGT